MICVLTHTHEKHISRAAIYGLFIFLLLCFADIDRLLGEPIENELETSSGIAHFFESVQLINIGRNIAYKYFKIL